MISIKTILWSELDEIIYAKCLKLCLVHIKLLINVSLGPTHLYNILHNDNICQKGEIILVWNAQGRIYRESKV